MSSIQLLLDRGEMLDEVVQMSLPEGGDLAIITKDNATQKGNPIACLTFTVQTRDGRRDRVQAVVTLRNLLEALSGLRGRYSHLLTPLEHDGTEGESVSGLYRGVGFDAIAVREVWLLSIEGTEQMGLAKTKSQVEPMAHQLIDHHLT